MSGSYILNAFQGISSNGYSLSFYEGRIVLSAANGTVIELNEDEISDLSSVSADKIRDLRAAYEKVRAELFTREQIVGLAVSSHAFAVKNENIINEVDSCLQQAFIALQTFLYSCPQKSAKYQAGLWEVILNTTLGQNIRKGNPMEPRGFWSRLKARFRPNPQEEILRRCVRELRYKIILNQQLFEEYLSNCGETVEDVVNVSRAKCSNISNNLQVQIETLDHARRQLHLVQKRFGIACIKLAVAEKLQTGFSTPAEEKPEAVAKAAIKFVNAVAENSNVINIAPSKTTSIQAV